MAFRLFPVPRPVARLGGQDVSPRAGFFPASSRFGGIRLDKDSKQALQVAKEITVKFIEIGRISPNNFPEFFSTIYDEVLRTIRSTPEQAPADDAATKE